MSAKGTYSSFFISQPQSIDSDMDCDPLFVLARCSDGHLQVLQRLLAHSIPSGLPHLENPNEFRLELYSITEKSGWFRPIGEICGKKQIFN
jgi:hypothetical protein